jgi:hypothetical protein
MPAYHCEGLNDIAHGGRVRNINDAARTFSHRLGVKMFGRSGRCLSLQRIRSGSRWVLYQAQLGRLRGPAIWTMLTVTER